MPETLWDAPAGDDDRTGPCVLPLYEKEMGEPENTVEIGFTVIVEAAVLLWLKPLPAGE